MNETLNINSVTESPFQHGIEQSFAKHQNQSNVSYSIYRREKHLALQKELQGRTLIYLDTKLSPNDISDFQHAAVAVPYFDTLFCDDGMASMLKDKPLEFGKIYNTDIISRPNEIRDYLVRLLN